jgi:hypothetical protein
MLKDLPAAGVASEHEVELARYRALSDLVGVDLHEPELEPSYGPCGASGGPERTRHPVKRR